MAEEPLPCPICVGGGRPYIQKYINGRTPPDETYRVICRDCRSGVRRTRTSAAQAVDDWNTWPRWRRPHAGLQNLQERKKADDRIYWQRFRLRELERAFGGKIQVPGGIVNQRLLGKIMEQAKEINRLRALIAAPTSKGPSQ